MKRIISILLSTTLLLTAACAAEEAGAKEYFTERDLAGTWKQKKAVNIALSESITLTEEGVYVLSGTIKDGTVTVDAGKDAKVQLVLDNVHISCSTSAAILVESADKVFITLPEGSESTLTCTGFDAEDGSPDGAVYARDDITFNGAGKLTITSARHGIVGKDDVKITGGVYVITAGSRGITANDSVRIADGTVTVVSEKDAIRAKNTEDADKGYLLIAGGTLDLTSGGGAENGRVHREDFGPNRNASKDENADSAKGLKATGWIRLEGGTVTVNAADDALHSDTTITVEGGTLRLSTGDDGIRAGETVTINGGAIDIAKSYEGIEATVITVNDGTVRLTAEDDGINCAGGNDGSGRRPNDMFAPDGSSIAINGGELHINASGDGMDSNGKLTVNGGKIVISGPTNAYNGALDANGTMSVHGGTVIAAGAKGMAESFGDSSTQVSFLADLKGGKEGDEITVKNAAGEILLSAEVEKYFTCVVISAPELQIGETYTVSSGCDETTVTVTEIATGGDGWGGSNGGPGRR